MGLILISNNENIHGKQYILKVSLEMLKQISYFATNIIATERSRFELKGLNHNILSINGLYIIEAGSIVADKVTNGEFTMNPQWQDYIDIHYPELFKAQKDLNKIINTLDIKTEDQHRLETVILTKKYQNADNRNNEIYKKLEEQVKSHESYWEFKKNDKYFIIHPNGISKGSTIKQLNQIGLATKDFIALGDLHLDIEMLENAYKGFVPRDAEIMKKMQGLKNITSSNAKNFYATLEILKIIHSEIYKN